MQRLFIGNWFYVLTFHAYRIGLNTNNYFLTSHSVNGMVNRQSIRSDMARVTMKTFLAVRMDSRPRTAHRMRTLPRKPTRMNNV